MTGEVKRYDEAFLSGATLYEFMFAGGALGFASSSPFAPKTTTGDRSYADYDPISYLAMSDFAGGMGQERLSDPTQYLDGTNVDTRGGRIMPRPLTTARASATEPAGYNAASTVWKDVKSGAYNGLASKIVPQYTGALYRFWVAVRSAVLYTDSIAIRLYDQVGGEPGNLLTETTVSYTATRPWGSWIEVKLASPETLTAGATYWVAVVQTSGDDGNVQWLATETTGIVNVYELQTGSWVLSEESAAFAVQMNLPATYPDAPLHLLTGAGEDTVPRVWGWAGRALYYIDNDTITAVQNGAGATYLTSADIMDAVWYRAAADSHAFLFVALGDSTDYVKFDGNVAGTEEWTTMTGHQARRFAVHDNLLWWADERNMVGGWDGAAAYGNTAPAGDRVYPIVNMCSWQGSLYIGKADGLYKLTYATGYPTSGDPTINKVLDLTPQADDDNFGVMVVHQDDLIFSLGQGLMRYTRGNVLTPISAETGLDRSVSSRSRYTAAFSSLGTLWMAVEGRPTEPSGILAWVDGKWHPIYNTTGVMLRGIVGEPGYFKRDESPTLHWGESLFAKSMQMPTSTQRTWLWDGMEYETTVAATWYASWFDGGIRIIEKDWITCTLDVEDYGTGSLGSVAVYWRPDEATAWEQVGATITAEGITELAFAAASHSNSMQLKIVNTGGSDGCLMVKAVVVGYMERPEDLRTHTRSYLLSSRGTWRNGTLYQTSLATQIENLRTLRSAVEPLTWYPWYGGSRTIHIVDYNAVEQPEEQQPALDPGTITVTVRLIEL